MANYLRYANQGATRNQPLDPRLVQALGYLGPLGVTAEVFSGGQDATGPNRVGSHRHDHGGSGDIRFYKGDKQLSWANPDDMPIFQQIVAQGKKAGITGFGAGPGYMGEGTMHVGFGSPGVWGAGGKGANAPEWLRAAYNGSPAGILAEAAPNPYAAMPDGSKGQEAYAPAPMAPDQTMVAGIGGGDPGAIDPALLRDKKEGGILGDFFSALEKYPDARPANMGPMGDARQGSDGLLKYLAGMKPRGILG